MIMKESESDQIEEHARALRLNEQAIFQQSIKKKGWKFKRLLFITFISFAVIGVMWLLFHCVPLTLNARH
jgi:hypothetical protein